MNDTCQPPEPVAIAVSGIAGSGKSTLGRALAASLRLPLVDLDAVTNPLLDALDEAVLGGHWLSGPHARTIREGRYAALRAVAADAVATAGGVVLVAPFTTELDGGEEWAHLRAAVAPATLRMVHLEGDPQLLAARRAARGAPRDRHRTDTPARTPSIPVVRIDAELSTSQQSARVLAGLGIRTPLDPDAALFSRSFDAVLFDLDGTLVDSTASVIRAWRRFAAHYGVSSDPLHENHGQPARTLIARLLPAELRSEGLDRILELELADAVALPEVRGARAFYDSIPAERRAVVTSGTAPLATARLRAARFTAPGVFVTSDDVTRGKPDPEPFLLAADRLGVDPERCLVLEDATAGIQAARAAGCAVIAVTGTVEPSALPADLAIDGLDRLTVSLDAEGIRLHPVG
ncbi:HAD-IA family hydrolase [Microbacterium sp. NPDC028030]|uniref:HAD-IA family hydrolase n=1 Tax=Microbacterium sp. NPDC028030 TaxID=3155124 RepID=UPI0033E70873